MNSSNRLVLPPPCWNSTVAGLVLALCCTLKLRSKKSKEYTVSLSHRLAAVAQPLFVERKIKGQRRTSPRKRLGHTRWISNSIQQCCGMVPFE